MPINTILELLFKDPSMFLVAIILLIVPLIISITLHEAAHGFLAYYFGDPTPKLQGRLTLNPLAHLDPWGTVMLFVIGIGWAKPVIINTRNIHGKTKQMLVALAGPAMNLLLAVIFTFILVFLIKHFQSNTNPIMTLVLVLINLIIKINFILAIFNMLPIPPLDGSKIFAWMLPKTIAEQYLRLESYGMLILLLIIFTVGFGFVFEKAVFLQKLLFQFVFKLL